MKRFFTFTLIFAAAALLIPAIPVIVFRGAAAPQTKEESSANSTQEQSEKALQEDFYSVLDVSTGKIIEVSVLDYVIGAVCAEMPATFEGEALKAQAVAAHTYAERQRLRELENPTAELCGADFSNDTSKYQGYFTENQARQYYGENFDMYYGKISEAVKEVVQYVITYKDEPIVSAFHSLSSGVTESAENAWGSPVDYLVSVDSSSDTAAPKYLEQVRFGKELLSQKLTAAFQGAVLGGDFTQWIAVGELSPSGTVLTASVGGVTITGNDIRQALGLRSACFELAYEGQEAVFTTKGYGHGVGMSQYGANSMAQQGSTWQDILLHYYPGCELEETKQTP